MAINFPDSPSINDEYNAGTKSWKWDGVAWRLIGDGFPPLSIDELTDVAVLSPADGEMLQYDGTGWVNTTSPTSEPMGHENKSESTISFDESTRTFSIAPVSASFTVWCKGLRYVKTTTDTVVIPDTSSLYYIYYNDSAVLSYKTSVFDLHSDTPVAYVYWNADDNKQYFFADERHGITLDWATHAYLHKTRGTAYASGLGAGAYTTTGDGSSDTHMQLDIANGVICDEDLNINITHSETPTPNTWQQVLEGAAEIPILYRSGSVWKQTTATQYPIKSGTSLPQYNQFTGGTWTTTDLTTDKYGVTYIVATNNLNHPIIGILGQTDFQNLNKVAESNYFDLDLSGLPAYELRPLYKLTYLVSSTFTNAPKAAIREVIDIRVTGYTGAGVSTTPVSDHGALLGLSDDDHPQYLDTTRHDSLDHSTAMGSVVLDDISNVSASAPSTGDFLKYNGSSWVPDAIPTINSLDDVGDVTITSASSGQILSFDGSAWINSAPISGVPTGAITQFAAASAPSGWLLCDGSNVSRTTYAALFEAIGTTYGAGNGSTTFGIPNLKGRVPVGLDTSQAEFDALGETGGAKTHTLTVSEMPSHTHTQDAHTHTGTTNNNGSHSHGYIQPYNTSGMGPAGSYGFYHYARGAITDAAGEHAHSFTTNSATATNQNTGGGQAHNNLQPYIVLNYIIKT